MIFVFALWLYYIYHCINCIPYNFLHTTIWIQSGEKLMSTVDIHWWISILYQFAHARTPGVDDFTMLVLRVHAPSRYQIEMGHSWWIWGKWVIDACFHNICVFKLKNGLEDKVINGLKWMIIFVWSVVKWFVNHFHVTMSLEKITDKSPHSWPNSQYLR